ncbi:60S ribosomal L18A [Cryptosporidium sp. chipmunk genotype I]|uniref:60S ribosomal L18A n=1 Tax=Cryptosporidium sp. chipmunk genotype I TaxID=1280935 RepID=UPI00351A34A0|nr:60S ribosomal L18A [Cryptosporidium sp. chipmunk genotype I]
MKKSMPDPSLQMKVNQYMVIGRGKPTELNPHPKVFRVCIFAPNEVVAKSRFFYFMSRLNKVKKANGEILSVTRIFEKRPTYVKNFAILLQYRSRTNVVYMYKEYRDISKTGAVSQMYEELAGSHRAQRSSIQIIRVSQIDAKLAKRPKTTQFFNSKLKFPAIRKLPMAPKALRSTFTASRPTTFQK